MIAALTLAMCMVAAPTPATIRILVLDVKSDSVAAETTRAIREEIAVELARDAKLSVLSTEDLRAAVSIEAESRALGCDSTSCLAEVGAAMGARFIVHASVATVGGARAVYLNLFDTERNEAVAREVVEAATDAQLLASVRVGAARIRERIGGRSEPGQELPGEPLDMLVVAGGVTASAGIVGVVVGGAVALGQLSTVNDLDGATVADRQSAQGTGAVATIITGISMAVVAGGAGLLVWGLAE